MLRVKISLTLSIVTALILLVTFPVGFAFDERKPKRTPEQQFKRMDKNGDGSLTLKEFVARAKADRVARREKSFKRKDSDSNGLLTLDEFAAPAKKAKKKRKQG